MRLETLQERFFETLITGDRPATRALVEQAEKLLGTPQRVLTDLYWPTHQSIEKLYRADHLSRLSHHMAVRLLRVCIDQTSSRLERPEANGRTVLAFCGGGENEELGAQMAVDLLESHGFSVRFAGAGVCADEILARVQEAQPDVLLMFCSAASDLPEIRSLIDQLRTIGASRNTQVAVGGGVFNRADGLAEEIGADLWARNPLEMVDTLIEQPLRRADAGQRTVGKSRRKPVEVETPTLKFKAA